MTQDDPSRQAEGLRGEAGEGLADLEKLAAELIERFKPAAPDAAASPKAEGGARG